MSAPLAVCIGGIGKLPYGGVTMYYVHHVLGLLELGYRVHYVERQNRELETYDPIASVGHGTIMPPVGAAAGDRRLLTH